MSPLTSSPITCGQGPGGRGAMGSVALEGLWRGRHGGLLLWLYPPCLLCSRTPLSPHTFSDASTKAFYPLCAHSHCCVCAPGQELPVLVLSSPQPTPAAAGNQHVIQTLVFHSCTAKALQGPASAMGLGRSCLCPPLLRCTHVMFPERARVATQPPCLALLCSSLRCSTPRTGQGSCELPVKQRGFHFLGASAIGEQGSES